MARSQARPDLHARFLAVVQAGLARANREHAEHLARLRPRRRRTLAEARRRDPGAGARRPVIGSQPAA